MDFSKMPNADKIIAIGAIAAIVGCFLPWWSFSAGILGSYSVSGLNEIGWLAFLAAVCSLLLIGLPMFGQKLPKLPVEGKMLQMILGGIVVAIPIIQVLRTMGTGLGIGVSFGVFITAIGGAAIVYGAYAKGGKNPTTPQEPTIEK